MRLCLQKEVEQLRAYTGALEIALKAAGGDPSACKAEAAAAASEAAATGNGDSAAGGGAAG